MKTHELKCRRGPFAAVIDGRKTYEVRRDDRGFEPGDQVLLKEWDPSGRYRDCNYDPESGESTNPGAFTGREWRGVITYKTEGGTWGIPAGFCVLGLRKQEGGP